MTKLEFFQKIKDFADSHNMNCTLDKGGLCNRGDWCVCVDYGFSTGYERLHRSEIYFIEEYPDGCIFWREEIHDGKHRISGPGYVSSISTQKPVKLEWICEKFLKELKHSHWHYEPIK